MIPSKKYQAKEITLSRIMEHIRELSAKGIGDLPSERDLSVMSGASRGIIRNILSELEAQGVVEKGRYGRKIAHVRNEIPVIFSAVGRNMIENPAWAKLWFALTAHAPEYGIRLELVLSGWPLENALESIDRVRNSNTKYVIFSNSAELFFSNHFDFKAKNCISVDESDFKFVDTIISLDNYEAGRLAAESLYNAGFRSPALVWEELSKLYTPFINRVCGFVDFCRDRHVKYELVTIPDPANDFKKHLMDSISTGEYIANEKRFDSIFAISDEFVPVLSDAIREQGIDLPAEMGFMMLNASNSFTNFRYHFPAISHATEGVSRAILQSIRENADKGTPISTRKIKPRLHNQESLFPKKTASPQPAD